MGFVPQKLTQRPATLAAMSFAIALTDEQWELVADLFDPPGRRGAPAFISRRQMVDAMLFIGRTGCQWRYLPERYGTWTAVWAQWRRWRANGCGPLRWRGWPRSSGCSMTVNRSPRWSWSTPRP